MTSRTKGSALRMVATALVGAAVAAGGPAPASPAGPGLSGLQARASPSEVVYGEWRDEVRRRTVPYKMYLPRSQEPAPVVLFSHGLGGSREAAGFLLEALAEAGFVAVSIQHPGTDESILAGVRSGEGRQALSRLTRGPDARAGASNRFGDVRFVIDRLAAEHAGGRFAGRFDLTRLGMSGHSYGALTTLVAVGQGAREAALNPYQDRRIDAAIVYSPNAPRNQDPETALAGIRTPILHFTGTEDRTPFDLEETPDGRTIPFRTITGADQYLIILTGGDHQIFGGRVQRNGAMTPVQTAQTETIVRESLIFWRAYLMEDRDALNLLCDLPQRVAGVAHGETRASRCTPDR